MAHFIPCSKDINAEKTAALLFSHVFCLHGLPSDITSDRGPQFASKFWAQLFALLSTKVNLSSAYHPESDGQSKRVNQVLEQYLHCTLNYQQDNWVDLLPSAEFAYNNSVHSSTGHSPFYSNFGFHPRFHTLAPGPPQVPAAEDLTSHLHQLQQILQQELTRAQAQCKKFADRKHQDAPSFSVGNMVWLLSQNIHTTRPSAKLDFKCLGPFPILAQVNPVAFRLQLPDSFKIHNVFHVSLLEPYVPNTIPGHHPDPPAPVVLDDVPEYEVESILDSRIVHKKLFYLVDWKGYNVQERSWEPASHLTNATDAVALFHQLYPHKPGSSSAGSAASRRHCLRRG